MEINLIVDDREKAVVPFLDQIEYPYVVKRITIADYIICAKQKDETTILAAIERKSLKDFAASFKDMRYENKQKMINLRDKTNCKLFFIIEGPAFVAPTKQIAHIPYGNILSAITNLMVRDNIFIIQTENKKHTAKRLNDLLKSFKTHIPTNIISTKDANDDEITDMIKVVSTDEITNATDEITDVDDINDADVNKSTSFEIPKMLTETTIRPEVECVMIMWKSLKGIQVVFSQSLVEKYSFIEFASLDQEIIKGFKTAIGHKLNKHGIKSLLSLRNAEKDSIVRILTGINGISLNIATQIAEINIFTATIKELSNIDIKQKTRTIKLGKKRAQTIYNLLRFDLKIISKNNF